MTELTQSTSLSTEIFELRVKTEAPLQSLMEVGFWRTRYRLADGCPWNGAVEAHTPEGILRLAVTDNRVFRIDNSGTATDADLATEAILISRMEGLSIRQAVWRVSWRASGTCQPESKHRRILRHAEKRLVQYMSEKDEEKSA
jgi:hypothetical protein